MSILIFHTAAVRASLLRVSLNRSMVLSVLGAIRFGRSREWICYLNCEESCNVTEADTSQALSLSACPEEVSSCEM